MINSYFNTHDIFLYNSIWLVILIGLIMVRLIIKYKKPIKYNTLEIDCNIVSIDFSNPQYWVIGKTVFYPKLPIVPLRADVVGLPLLKSQLGKLSVVVKDKSFIDQINRGLVCIGKNDSFRCKLVITDSLDSDIDKVYTIEQVIAHIKEGILL